jgi:type I restriction enzyme S subunit
MADRVPFRGVVQDAIGGGWGQELAFAGSIPVAVIRGTDFDRARSADYSAIPRRHEERRKALRRLLRPRDVILEVSGGSPTSGQTTGRSLLVTDQIVEDMGSSVIPASFCRLVRFREDIVDPRYAFYSLQDMYLSGRAGDYEHQSTGISNFQFEYFLDEETIRLPPLDEQRAIAHILGTLDDKIELNRRMNETLEAIARALFKSWFVDFDPVRAKAERRDSGLPSQLADLFPDSCEDSDLGEIPKGWIVGSVDDEFALTMGQSPPGDTYNLAGVGLPFYQGSTDFGPRFPTRRVYCTAPTRFAKAGDTLVSVRAPVGDINMASEDCAVGRGVAAVRHNTASRSYTYWFMKSIGEVFARFEAEGTVFGSIGKKDFHAIPCIMPPRELVRAYEMRVSPLDDRVEVNERENRSLAALRDSLLPKLISGELRVKDAERLVETGT